jgi:isopenicillin N synthase-like dioxygenase
MLIYTPPKPADTIPIIDLSENAETAAHAVHMACRETGFFYVKNHGVLQSVIDNQFDLAKRFFVMPVEAKMAIDMRLSPSLAGYEPFGSQTLDSQDSSKEASPADFKEGFNFAADIADDHPMALRKMKGYGHNRWPQIIGFREQSLNYQRGMEEVGHKILSLLARSLAMPADWFVPSYEMGSCTVRMLRYPPQPSNAPFNQLGAGAHTDWGGITILAQDSVGGLEVRNAAGEWIVATPIPGTFVVNLGDLMARWTNGIYNSNLHRVKNNTGDRDRYSIASFYAPFADALIEAVPTCVDADHPRRYVSCSAAEHIMEMFARSRRLVGANNQA